MESILLYVDMYFVAMAAAGVLLFSINITHEFRAALCSPSLSSVLFLGSCGLFLYMMLQVLISGLAFEAGYAMVNAQDSFRLGKAYFAVQAKKNNWWGEQLMENMDL